MDGDAAATAELRKALGTRGRRADVYHLAPLRWLVLKPRVAGFQVAIEGADKPLPGRVGTRRQTMWRYASGAGKGILPGGARNARRSRSRSCLLPGAWLDAGEISREQRQLVLGRLVGAQCL